MSIEISSPSASNAALGAKTSHAKQKGPVGALGVLNKLGEFGDLMGRSEQNESRGQISRGPTKANTSEPRAADQALPNNQALSLDGVGLIADKMGEPSLIVGGSSEQLGPNTKLETEATGALSLFAFDRSTSALTAGGGLPSMVGMYDRSGGNINRQTLERSESLPSAPATFGKVIDSNTTQSPQLKFTKSDLPTLAQESNLAAALSAEQKVIDPTPLVADAVHRELDVLKHLDVTHDVGTIRPDHLGSRLQGNFGAEVRPSVDSFPLTNDMSANNVWISGDLRNAELTVEGISNGSIEVSINMHGNQTHVAFRTDEDQARSLLEATALSLKETLATEGIELSGVSIGFTDSGSGQPQHQAPRREVVHAFDRLKSDSVQSAVRSVIGKSDSRLDVYV